MPTNHRYIKHPNPAVRRKLGVYESFRPEKVPGAYIKPTKALKGWGYRIYTEA